LGDENCVLTLIVLEQLVVIQQTGNHRGHQRFITNCDDVVLDIGRYERRATGSRHLFFIADRDFGLTGENVTELFPIFVVMAAMCSSRRLHDRPTVDRRGWAGDHPQVVASMDKVIASAGAAGMPVGNGQGTNVDTIAALTDRGIQWFQTGGDCIYLVEFFDRFTADLRARLATNDY